MIATSNLTLRFGDRALLDNVSFLISRKDKIGLTGKNGAGKSTLLKLLSGKNTPDEGTISYPKETRIGHLTQDISLSSHETVLDEAKKAFAEVLNLEKKVKDLTHQLETREDYESDDYMDLINDLGDAQNHLNLLDADNIEADTELVLKGLGFERNDLSKKMNELSGGWQMRVELAKILLQKPDLVLLDEPTNHLDIESIQWLEVFLKNYDGAVVLVSHDVAFLDAVTNRTLEVSMGKIEDYKTNYTHYLELRKERKEQQENAYKNQQEQIKQIEKNIDKFRAKANKASFAQSLIKQLDRMDKIELDEEDNAQLNIRFPKASHAGKLICEAHNVSKNYGEQKVIKGFNLTVERGDKIAFVGKNGMGKSTMLKILADDIDNYNGDIKWGHQILKGYFAQEQAVDKNNKRSVFDTINDEATGDVRSQIRSLLGAFMFSGNDVDKKVSVLSGGERGRLAMCKLLLKPYNFLLLDEPTNHLDIKSKEKLKEALNKYDGTLIIVSHDRDFLNDLTTKTYEFTEQGIKEYLGTIQEFLDAKKVVTFREFEKSDKIQPIIKEEKLNQAKTVTDDKKIKKIEKEIEQIENKILEFEDKIASQQIPENSEEFYSSYQKLKVEHEKLMKTWEEEISY